MFNRCRPILSALVIVFLLSACSDDMESASYSKVSETVSDSDSVERFLIMDIDNAAASSSGNRGISAQPEAVFETLGMTPDDRQLIKIANLNIEVDDAPSIAKSISDTAKSSGGYIADTSRKKIGDNRFSISMTVRMPSDKFDQATEDFQGLGTVLFFKATAQDVTEEYVDTESRARNLKKSEERLLDHLSRSAKLEDILKAEKEITRVRGQIEQLDGRLRYLSNRVAFSSIVIHLQDKPGAEQATPKEAYSALHIASQASRSLIQFSRSLLTLCIWIGVWSPIWLPIVLLSLLIRKRVRLSNSKG